MLRHGVRRLVKYKVNRKIGWTYKFKLLREKQMDVEDMLLDGLLCDDFTDEYLAKLKDLEIRLQEKVSLGNFWCKVKHAKVYKQMSEIHDNNTSEKLQKIINHHHDT